MKSIRLTGFVRVEDIRDMEEALAEGEVGKVESFKVVRAPKRPEEWMDGRRNKPVHWKRETNHEMSKE